jgi:hypothetical protein
MKTTPSSLNAVLASCLCLASVFPATAVVFISNTLIETNNLTYEGQDVVVNGCTLTINGAHSFNSVTVTNCGGITQSPCVYNSVTNRVDLTVAGDMFVDYCSRVDVTGKGYGTGTGPGAGGYNYNGYSTGGGYGGRGGLSGGLPYGSMTEPVYSGSGGGAAAGNAAGGGAVRLFVTGRLLLDGSVLANGLYSTVTDQQNGAGAGGSVYLQVGTLSGAGAIQANGGTSIMPSGGSGGGGRIAIYYATFTHNGQIQARGGGGSLPGGVGTIYLKGDSQAPQLVLANGGFSAGPQTTVAGAAQALSVAVHSGANVQFTDLSLVSSGFAVTNSAVTCLGGVEIGGDLSVSGAGAVLAMNWTNSIQRNVAVLSGATLTHSSGATNGVLLNVLGDMTVDSTSRVDVTGKGYGTGTGPGAGGYNYNGYSTGGGYGGRGGLSGGLPYGSMTEPAYSGSGGGANSGSAPGGGAVRLFVTGQLLLDGPVLANGVASASTDYQNGGGAGGSVYLRVGTLSGTNAIRANGGSSIMPSGGSGGGGRIAIYQHCSLFTGSLQAAGGAGSYPGGTGTVYVVWVNAPPTLPSQPDVTLNELESLTVANVASDIDCPPNEMTYKLEGAPEGASISADGIITWAPSEMQGPGTYTIKTIVTDYNPLALINQRLSATNSFTVTVNEMNVAPVLNLPGPVSLNEMTPLSVPPATATDVDLPANTHVFALVEGPPGLTMAEDTGAITWLPGEAVGPGVYTVTAKVTDYNPWAVNEQHLSTTNSFTITVNEVNRPPTITVPENQVMVEETPLVISASASDPDIPLNGLTFSLLSSPVGMTIDPASGAIAWTPTEAQGSNVFTVTVVVTDDSPFAVNERNFSATNSFTVTVNESNRPPVLIFEQTNRVISELTLLVVTNTATDADLPANGLTYTLIDPPEGATIDTNGVITWTPTEAQGPGTNVITTVVTDYSPDAVNGTRLSATNSFSVAVQESNAPPVLTAVPDQFIHAGGTLVVTNRATDPDSPTQTLVFSFESALPGATIDPASGLFSWTSSVAQAGSSNSVSVKASDNGTPSLSDSKTFMVSVVAPLEISSVSLTNGMVRIVWNSIPGSVYRVEYGTNLTSTVWTGLAPDVAATGGTCEATDVVSGEQKSYRVRWVK